jgi:hypothetical protein
VTDGPNTITASSPNVADVVNPNAGGAVQPAVVIGDLAGNVYAYDLATGEKDWAYSAGAPVQSTPSVAPTTAGNAADSLFVAVGDAGDPHPSVPGYQAITPQGNSQWKASEKDPFNGASWGAQSSMAVGNLQGQTDVVGPSIGENTDAYNATTGASLNGFPWFQADSSFATPALADVLGNGGTQIVEAGAGSTGLAYGYNYLQGGYVHVVQPDGNGGNTAAANDGTDCLFHSSQEIDSSPAVGQFLSGSANGIVFGTGTEFSGASDTNKVFAINSGCVQAWSATLNGATSSSPALADVLGNGQLQVIEGTSVGGTSGSVYALNGTTGATIWNTSLPTGAVLGGVATADLGGGYQDVIVPTTDGVYILDGKTGAVIQSLLPGDGFQNTPLVTDDANGDIGITLAGYQGSDSYIWHYQVAGSTGSKADEAGAWPQFHHDPQLTGNAGTPPPTIQVPCNAPTAPAYGYDLTASDGGVFNFGNLPFCGSTGAITLNKPIVGIAVTHDAGGYWLDASDGGIFAFGDAKYYGSVPGVLAPGQALNKPIVGMAATPDGGGYWLVASDGGIFAFGDAKYYGSVPGVLKAGQSLNKPIVGMAATPDGGGYWLVASDGGVFSFGDAVSYGSMGGKPLNKPVVGIAAAPGGTGYWLAASDGGVFSFGTATFYGSVPGQLKPGQVLNAPIVGMQATSDGKGYRFVASDGGVFNFGDAVSYGSQGGKPLNKPVVGIAGF